MTKSGKPIETPVREWDLPTNAQGSAAEDRCHAGRPMRSELPAYRSGRAHDRRRISFHDHRPGGRRGRLPLQQPGTGAESGEYAPGQTVNLMVNTDRTGGTVLLFVRPANGVYLPPKVLRLTGKSFVDEISVVQKDMPNFFIEALSISDGRVHSVSKEIVVPPEKRVIEVSPEAIGPVEYKPGQQAKVQLRPHGYPWPAAGKNPSTVVAVYDKVGRIHLRAARTSRRSRSSSGKWRRQHYPRNETSLDRGSGNLTPPTKPGMENLGLFGESVVEETKPDADGENTQENGINLHASPGIKSNWVNGICIRRGCPRSKGRGGSRHGALQDATKSMNGPAERKSEKGELAGRPSAAAGPARRSARCLPTPPSGPPPSKTWTKTASRRSSSRCRRT